MSDLAEIEIPSPLPIDAAHLVSTSKVLRYQPANRIVGVLLWPLWPLLDPHTGRPSAPRCMAWAIYLAFLINRPIPAMVCGLLLATVFGYSMFKEALGKSSFSAVSADTVSLKHEYTETVNRQIIERRDPDKGIEASP